MSEPRRLLEEGGSDLELVLLRSARDDRPPPQARRRALVALGLGGGILGAGATVSTTTAASTSIATASKLAILKWIGVGIVGGLLTAGGINEITRRGADPASDPESSPRSREDEAARAPVAHAGSSPSDDRAAAPLAAPSDEPSEGPRSSPALAAKATRDRSASAAKASEPRPSLADEVAVLDSAREALAGSDPARALQVLEEHDRRFSAGVLSPEAMVLRIEATLARGDRPGAIRLANEFLAAHPRSTHESRVRSVLAAAQAGP